MSGPCCLQYAAFPRQRPQFDHHRFRWYLGAGVEQALAPAWSVRFECEYKLWGTASGGLWESSCEVWECQSLTVRVEWSGGRLHPKPHWCCTTLPSGGSNTTGLLSLRSTSTRLDLIVSVPRLCLFRPQRTPSFFRSMRLSLELKRRCLGRPRVHGSQESTRPMWVVPVELATLFLAPFAYTRV